MKKIPTLFVRIYQNHRVVGITENVTPGMEWVMRGEGIATVKIDGSCCAIINGEFYKRYDDKKGKQPPEGAIPCCEPDPVTGHWPHWVRVDFTSPADMWHVAAYNNTQFVVPSDGTYEAIGPHFQGNPYGLQSDKLERHGEQIIEVERTYAGIEQYLSTHEIEGIVFWLNGKPECKIKRSDFGLSWPAAEREVVD